VVVQISCDLCGAEVSADSGTEFAVGGRAYRVDLCAADRDRFVASLAPYVEVAEVVTGRRASTPTADRASRRGAGRRDADQVGAIRAWARENGCEISDRGRIPATVEDAYNARRENS
jgi:hypothetical protein